MTTQITLVTPPLSLETSLTLRPASAVILRLAVGDERTQINVVKHFAPLFQAQNTAVMVESSPEVAIRGGADGIHCTSLASVKAAKRHRPKYMVGVGGVFDRDAAMALGEEEVDYLYFETFPKRSFQDYLAHLTWWAEIFTIPAIGQVQSHAQIAQIAATNVEFVALHYEIWGA